MSEKILWSITKTKQEPVDVLEDNTFVLLNSRCAVVMVEDLAPLTPFFAVIHPTK